MPGIALLGAGIFAKTEHLPAIQAAESLDLLAVYSRSQASADALATLAAKDESKPKPKVYYDNSPAGADGLDALLARDDIAAVIVCLPILTQPDVIRQALAAGKHVLSEKPIAPDVAGAQALLKYYSELPSDKRPIWSVAENFRYLPPLHDAAAALRAMGGRLVAFSLTMNGYIKETNEFYNTDWRKAPGYQGGFLLDGGVHFMAGLRFLLAAAGGGGGDNGNGGGGDEIQRVAGFSSLLEARLPPVDSVHAVASTRAGINGTVSLSFGTEFGSGLEVCIVTTEGRVTWSPEQVTVVTRSSRSSDAAAAADDKKDETKKYEKNFGVVPEVAAFAKSIAAGVADPLQSPQEALKDLALLQALLESGPSGAIKTVS